MGINNVYSESFRRNAVSEVRAGFATETIAKRLGMQETSLETGCRIQSMQMCSLHRKKCLHNFRQKAKGWFGLQQEDQKPASWILKNVYMLSYEVVTVLQ